MLLLKHIKEDGPMRRVKKPVFFIVAAIILALAITATLGVKGQNGDNDVIYLKGVEDIRWGIDIQGGVEASFTPATDEEVTNAQIDAAEAIVESRLIGNNITDYELYTDYGAKRIIVRFPWQSGESDYNPEEAIEEISATALLTFREGNEHESESVDANGAVVYRTPAGTTAETVILQGNDIESAEPQLTQDDEGNLEYVILLHMTSEAADKFAEATARLVGKTISIWMDDLMISAPTVRQAISNGEAMITSGQAGSAGAFTAASASELANKINAGALPFALKTESFSTVSPTLGLSSLSAMALAGIIAFILIAIFMILKFRLPGAVAVLCLLGQTALSLAAVSGYFRFINSFTLTLPGIAGIILSIGMGVDCHIITASRIKEELSLGKTIDSALQSGFKNSISAIIDGNITVVIVAIILMLVFGPTNILSAIFGASTTGAIYSFGYTLLVGIVGNFLMGVIASRLMLKSLSGFKGLRKKWLFGGEGK